MTRQLKMLWKVSSILLLSLLMLLPGFSIAAEADVVKKPLTGLDVNSQRAPYELKLLIDHLVKQATKRQEIIDILGYCELINNDLKTSPGQNIQFMLKTEIYRGVLTNQYMKKDARLQISSTFVNSVHEKVKKFSVVYTDFSRWIAIALLQDLAPYRRDNFIDKYQSISRTEFEQKKRANRLKKILSYVTPWFELLEKLSPEDFNKFTKKIAIDTLRNISARTYYFKEFSQIYQQEKENFIFTIPEVKLPPKEEVQVESETEEDLEEAAAKARAQAEELMKSMVDEEDDMSNASEAIDKIAPTEDKKDPPKEKSDPNRTWIPQ
jgi:hypothetical protein